LLVALARPILLAGILAHVSLSRCGVIRFPNLEEGALIEVVEEDVCVSFIVIVGFCHYVFIAQNAFSAVYRGGMKVCESVLC
jgi:hypothetical protein